MSVIGLDGDVVARMSKPPPKSSMSFTPFTNEPVVIAPMTSVKTTSVNIASVTPVRNRLRSGYAIEMRRTGASARTRPSVAPTAPAAGRRCT